MVDVPSIAGDLPVQFSIRQAQDLKHETKGKPTGSLQRSISMEPMKPIPLRLLKRHWLRHLRHRPLTPEETVGGGQQVTTWIRFVPAGRTDVVFELQAAGREVRRASSRFDEVRDGSGRFRTPVSGRSEIGREGVDPQRARRVSWISTGRVSGLRR